MGILENQIQKIRKMSYLPLSPASQLDLTPNGSLSRGGLRLSMFSLLPTITGASLLRLLILFPTQHSGICIIFVNPQAQAPNSLLPTSLSVVDVWPNTSRCLQKCKDNFTSSLLNWNFIDQDGSGGLNFNEFKYTFAGFAAVDSRVIMKAFDADNNGLLDSSELTAWRAYVREIVTAWGWSLSDGQISELDQAWKNAQDTDENSASMIEIARFLLSSYNIFLH